MAAGEAFRPSGQHELGPSGQVSRVTANLEAIRTLRTLQDEGRPAAPGEQAILARWSGWGAVPGVFDEAKDRFADARTELRALLSEEEYAAARRTTINAHYTDAAIVRTMWDAVTGLGFDGGAALEPGCGSGNFIGFAPPSARMLGVELDPVTAGIAAALYPDAEIRSESFADSRLPDGGFDLVIGNVPFSSAILTDPRHNAARHSMHNHFIVKSLALTRPGGLVAVLTSRYTMDAAGDAARREMAGLADLVTAVRLPSGAHRRAAGTEAVTDLLILRRREDGRPKAGAVWQQSQEAGFEGGTARVSEYFREHPDNVLGELAVDDGQYGAEELIVRPRDLERVPVELADRLAVASAEATAAGLSMSRPGPERMMAEIRPGGGRVSLRVAARDASRFEGTITAHGDGTFTVLRDGETRPWPCPDSQAPELRALLRLRDTVCSLLDAEKASADDTPQIAALRERLNREYDACTEVHGPLNRAAWRRTGRTDEAGNETFARQAPAQGGFSQDPYSAVVYMLEEFDPDSGTASKAAIFTQRVIADRSPATSADTPEDAVAICMDADGEVRLNRAASLLGLPSQEDARAALGELVYDEPDTGKLIPAAEYLSGKVRAKLALAEKAAQSDPRYQANAEALRRVLPADLGPGEIDARLGASWIPPQVVQQGLRAILQDRTLTVDKGYGTTWRVKGNTHSIESRTVYGTADKDALALAQSLLEGRPIQVRYSMDDLDPADRERLKSARSRDDMAAFIRARAAAATVTARAKADELSDRFTEWLWEDPRRASELTRIYNEKFNSLVLRSYDGARPRLPGLTAAFTPHPHQYAAVARIISEPAALLAHEVGAGKTAEMVMGAMELRRLGLVSKPAIIVPNHMLKQFQVEFLQLYPQARVLAAGAKDLEKSRRHAFVARIATGDWDAVIMTRSVFERIPMSAAEQERYIKAKLTAYDQWLERAAAENDSPRMVKRMETQRVSFEERLKRKLTRTRDAGIAWEQTGIDYLFIDEAHGHKNLDTRSNNPALDIDGSGRASDLEMKLDYLRRDSNRRVVTFATATPIANSMTEAYVMTRYLRPDLLADAGIEDFDAWAGSFAATATDVEVAPEGGLRVKERVASFHNVPELLLMWRVFADVKTAEDLKLPVPDLAGGKPEVVTVAPSSILRSFMLSLARRAEAVRMNRVKPDEDNMLKISSDGRAAALDMRLVGTRPPQEDGKLDIVADRIGKIYHDTRDNVYRDRDGDEESVRGGLQIVFCELGTPTGSSRFGVYEHLKAELSARGVPAGQIRFMHEARNDKAKADLFAAARAGKVSVLIGTTDLMGVGTNVQKRAVALHHIDCPWRPADVAQREGRILRQGNQNPQVQIIRYVTEGSFDAYMWQTVLRKSKFIAQVMHGSLDSRDMEDIGGSDALSYSEVTALATGDMRILAKAKADADVQRLTRLESSWRRGRQHLKTRIADGERDIPRLEEKAAAIEAAIARRTEMKGDAFHCDLNGKRFTKRTEAAEELQSTLDDIDGKVFLDRQADHLGTFGGLALRAIGAVDSTGRHARFSFTDVPAGSVKARLTDPPLGIIAKLENKLNALDGILADTRQEIADAKAEIERARASIDAPFAKATELARARSEADRLAAELGGQRALPEADPEAHETPVADATLEAEHEDDTEISPAADETWENDNADADGDDNPLDVTAAGGTSDEWDDDLEELDDESATPSAEPAGATADTEEPADAPTPQSSPEPAHESAVNPAPEETRSPVAAAAVKSADPRQAQAPTAPAPPAGAEPVASHRGWGGTLRPERLLYADGTPLTVLGETEDGDEPRPAIAAGSFAMTADSDYGEGHLQAVRWEDGGFATVHPARACHRSIDLYAGLSARDRTRWTEFDRYESYGSNVAYIPARLINPGDLLQVERGPYSRVMDQREVQSISEDTTSPAPVIRVSVRGVKNALQYPADHLTGVYIQADHPTLAAAIEAATGSRPNQPPEPARDDAPAQAASPTEPAIPQSAPQEPASPAEAAAPPPGAAIRIEHDHHGTRVYGTDKSQTAIRKALKAEGFKWSRQGYWYLNRSWRERTRADRVRGLTTTLGSLNVGYEVIRPGGMAADSGNSEPEITPPASTEPAASARPEAPTETAAAPTESNAHTGIEDVTSVSAAEPQPGVSEPKPAQDFEQESLFGTATTEASPEPSGEQTDSAADAPTDDTSGEETEHKSPVDAAPATDSAARDEPADRPESVSPLESLLHVPVDHRPYEGLRTQAESGSMWVESDYRAWQHAHEQAGDARLPDEHPRVVQFTRAWRAVWARGITDGPGPAAARYHTLAHASVALAAVTDPASNPAEINALNLLGTHARKHSARLRATAEHLFSQSRKSGRYANGREDAEKGTKIIDTDYRAWARTGVPAEAARDPLLWQHARRAELAWHSIRRSGLTDGPAPAAARYRELADAAQALADGFTANLPSHALPHLLELAEHAGKHSARLQATARPRKSAGQADQHQQQGDRTPPGGRGDDRALPDHVATVTQRAHASQHSPTTRQHEDIGDDQAARRRAATQRQTASRGDQRQLPALDKFEGMPP